MTKIFLTGLAMGTAMLIGLADANVAKAEPLTLTNAQLDNVTAGGWHRSRTLVGYAAADASAGCRSTICFVASDTHTDVSHRGAYAASSSTSIGLF